MNNFAKHPDVCGESTLDYSFDKVLYDYGTIHPSTNEESAYVTYKFDGFNDFAIEVSGNETIEGRFKLYGSADNKNWTEIEFTYPVPELSIYRFFHTTLAPKNKLSGYNYLKIEMYPKGWFANTRIREVKITKP